MPGADLILFVGGSVGVTALVLWIAFRRSRVRSQLGVATVQTAKLATVPTLAEYDDKRAIPKPVDAAARDFPDDPSVLRAAPPAEVTPTELGAPGGDEHLAPTHAAEPGLAAQSADMNCEDEPTSLASHAKGDAQQSEAAATARTADDSAEITGAPTAASENTALGDGRQALLPVEDGKELSDATAAVAGDEQAMPPGSELVGDEAVSGGGPDSYGHLLPSPPDGSPALQDDSHLADAIGDAGSRTPAAVTSLGQVLTAPDAPCDAAGELDRAL